MATLLLVRHGRTAANAQGILAGRAPGILLDDLGTEQAERTAERLAAVPLAAVVSSPLERTRETARRILEHQEHAPELLIDDELTECGYGEWQGRKVGELARDELWARVLRSPASVVFPGGESMAGMQARALAAVRRHDETIAAQHGENAVWAAVSHGDVIKSVLADALGMHLDLFQRIVVAPASVSIVRYGGDHPDVLAVNSNGGDLSWLKESGTRT